MANVNVSRKNLRRGQAKKNATDGVGIADWTTLVTFLNSVTTMLNEAKADFNATLVKKDADATVGDVNYASTLTISTADVDTISLVK